MSHFARSDRAFGSLIGLAAGDALGAGYEFKPRVPYTEPVTMSGGGSFGWAPGEWTDDTAMAFVIAKVAASGQDLQTESAQTEIIRGWYEWSRNASDVGIQTRSVLNEAGPDATPTEIRRIASSHHQRTGRSGGNGSLMRTAPVALAYLDDPIGLVAAATQISSLTHFDPEAGEACALWCLAIRHAINEANFNGLHEAVRYLPEDRREIWRERITAAENHQPWEFTNNGWVIHAFQTAWSAIVHSAIPAQIPSIGLFAAQHFEHALERAVRSGNDTDTVAAIAGSLLGARWGASAIPAEWQLILHGYPNASTKDLARLAFLIINKGPLDNGWPTSPTVDVSKWTESIRQGALREVSGLHLGGQSILRDKVVPFEAAISLSAVGDVEGGLEADRHLRIVVKDSKYSTDNPNLAFQMFDVSHVLDRWVSSGISTLLHCVQAQCRTPSFAAAYLVVAQGKDADWALETVKSQVQGTNPHTQFVDAIMSLQSPWWPSKDPVREFAKFSFLNDHHLVAEIGEFALTRRGGAWVLADPFEEERLPTDATSIAHIDEIEMTENSSPVLEVSAESDRIHP
jgi:ADP-ribosylglycohydrolase